MEVLLGIIIIVVAVAIFLAILFNKMVALRQNRQNAYADIDVQLKQRFDLIPNLVETVKGYAGHEKEVLTDVTQARAGVSAASGTNSRLAAEKTLGAAMMNLFAVAENYPDLKADSNFRQLMDELSDIENKIAAARRFFNNATSEYNTTIQQFPANLFAASFGFTSEDFFEVDERERAMVEKAPDVSF